MASTAINTRGLPAAGRTKLGTQAELEDDSSDEEPETKDPVQRPPVQEI